MSVGNRRKTSNPQKQIETRGSIGPLLSTGQSNHGMLSPFGYLIKDNIRKEDLLLKFQSLIAAKHTSALQGRPSTAVRSNGRQQQHQHILKTFGHASTSAGKEMTDQQYYLDQVRTPERKKSKRKKPLRRQSLCDTQNDAERSRGEEEALTTAATTKKDYKISPIKKKKKKTSESDGQDYIGGEVVITDEINMTQGEYNSPQVVLGKDTNNAHGSQILNSNRSSIKNKSARKQGGNELSSMQQQLLEDTQIEKQNVTPFNVQHQNLMKCEDQSEIKVDKVSQRDIKRGGGSSSRSVVDNDMNGEDDNEEESNNNNNNNDSINNSKKKSIPRRYDKLREILESRNEELEKMKLAMCGCIQRVKQIRIKHFSQSSLQEQNQNHPSFESELALLEQCIVMQQTAMKANTKGVLGAQQQTLQQQQITIPTEIQKALAQSELLTKEAAREKEWLCGRLREKERMVEELLKALSASNSDVEVLSGEVSQLRKQEEKMRKELEQIKMYTKQQESGQEEDQKDKEKLLKKLKELQEKEGIARETNIGLQLQLETSLGYLIKENDTLHREINILKGRNGKEEIEEKQKESEVGRLLESTGSQRNGREQNQKEIISQVVSQSKESLIRQQQVQQLQQKQQQFTSERIVIPQQQRGSLRENNNNKINTFSQKQSTSLQNMVNDSIESDTESKQQINLNQQDVAIISNQNKSAKKNSSDSSQLQEKVIKQQQLLGSEEKVDIKGRSKNNSFNYGDKQNDNNINDTQKSHYTFQQNQQLSCGNSSNSSKREIVSENKIRDMLNQSGIIGSQKELMREFQYSVKQKVDRFGDNYQGDNEERQFNDRNSQQIELDDEEQEDGDGDNYDNNNGSGQGDEEEEEEKERKSTIRSSRNNISQQGTNNNNNNVNDQIGDDSMFYGDVSNYSSDAMQNENKQQYQQFQTPKRSSNSLNSEGKKNYKDTENQSNKSGSSKSRKNSAQIIMNNNQDYSKRKKSTRSSQGRVIDDGNGDDNDSKTEYLTFERSQQGENEQVERQNSKEYQQLEEYFENEQQHQQQLMLAEAAEKQLFEQMNNRSRQSESQSSKNSLADSHSQIGKRTGQFGGQNSQMDIARKNSRGSEQNEEGIIENQQSQEKQEGQQ